MSTFKEIQGRNIKPVSSDPASAGGGDIWYNSTSNTLKGVVQNTAWSSVPSMIEGRSVQNMGTGPSTAALASGGNPGSGSSAATEEFNGTGWSLGGAMNIARVGGASCGTQTAAIITGGAPNLTTAESYNGSAWTSAPAINTGRWRISSAAAAPSTAAIIFAGELDPGTNQALTEEFNGTSWSEAGDLSTARGDGPGGAGSQTAAICFGGDSGSLSALAEEYNGTSWTAGGDLNTARDYLGSSGLQTSAVAFGGNTPPVTTATETYDGSSWTTSAAVLGTAQSEGTRAGTTGDTGLSATPGPAGAGAAEVFNVSANVITPGAWAAGGNLPAAKGNTNVSVGTATTCLSVGGMVGPSPSVSNVTDEYDGATWSGGGNYPTSFSAATGSGPAAASWVTGGITSHPNGPTISTTNTYDGSSWTGGTAYPGTIINAGGVGPQTAGLAWGGLATWTTWPGSTNTFEYDGPSWTAGGALPPGGVTQSGCTGTQTAALSSGGSPAGNANTSYNGSSWTAETVMPRSWPQSAASGTQTATISYLSGSPYSNVESIHWDGTSWATQPSLGTGRYAVVGRSGTATSAIAAGGYFGPPGAGRTVSTEEFTGPTSATNIKTFTTS